MAVANRNNSRTAPGVAEQKADNEKAEAIDPQAPEQKYPAGGYQAGDEKRGIGGKLSSGQTDSGTPSPNRAIGQKILFQIFGCFAAVDEAGGNTVDNKGKYNQQIENRRPPCMIDNYRVFVTWYAINQSDYGCLPDVMRSRYQNKRW